SSTPLAPSPPSWTQVRVASRGSTQARSGASGSTVAVRFCIGSVQLKATGAAQGGRTTSPGTLARGDATVLKRYWCSTSSGRGVVEHHHLSCEIRAQGNHQASQRERGWLEPATRGRPAARADRLGPAPYPTQHQDSLYLLL